MIMTMEQFKIISIVLLISSGSIDGLTGNKYCMLERLYSNLSKTQVCGKLFEFNKSSAFPGAIFF